MRQKETGAKIVVLGGGSFEGPILTVSQFEERHPGTRGRLRKFILRADLGMSAYQDLASAIIRLGRSVMLDEARVLSWLHTRTNQTRSPARNPHGRAGKRGRK